MGFGPVTIASTTTVDISAPGKPSLNIHPQSSNNSMDFEVGKPTGDADGSPLTGLTFGQAVVLPITAEEAEIYREDFEGALVADSATTFMFDFPATDETVLLTFPIAPGTTYSVLARAADHARPV